MQMSLRTSTFLNLLLSIPARASITPTFSTSTVAATAFHHPPSYQYQHQNQYHYSTMSSKPSDDTPTTNSNNNQGQSQSQPPQQEDSKEQPYLALPDANTADSSHILDVSGDGSTVKLDHLGPLVVNTDGTLARISNWAQMTEIEQRNTLRVLGKRNKQRLAALKGKEGDIHNQG